MRTRWLFCSQCQSGYVEVKSIDFLHVFILKFVRVFRNRIVMWGTVLCGAYLEWISIPRFMEWFYNHGSNVAVQVDLADTSCKSNAKLLVIEG